MVVFPGFLKIQSSTSLKKLASNCHARRAGLYFSLQDTQERDEGAGKEATRCTEAPGLGEQQTEKADESATGKMGCEEEGQGRTEGFPACEHQPVAGANSYMAKVGCNESPGASSEFCCFKDDDDDFRRRV